MNQSMEEQLAEALLTISTPSDREAWVKYGMSLHSALGPDGIDVWHTWSEQGAEYDLHEADAVYRSFKPTRRGVTEKTIFKAARKLGWRPSGKAAETTPEEKAAREDAYKKAEADRVAAQGEAATKAQEIWDKAKPVDEHPYLIDKGIEPIGIRQSKKQLVVPLTYDGALCNLQLIDEEGIKRFLTGGRVTGAYFLIGEVIDEVYIAEGFATGCTIAQIAGKPVCVAMNAGNLPSVASSLREQFPDAAICICADADEVGLRKAQVAALAVDGTVVSPAVANLDDISDFNDMAAVCDADEILEALKSEPEPEPEPEAEPEAEPMDDDGKAAYICGALEEAIGKSDIKQAIIIDKLQKTTGVPKAALRHELRKMAQSKKGAEVIPIFAGRVTGAEVAREILQTVNRHMFLANDEGVQITLWAMNTWVFQQMDILPKLAIGSPVPGCGKSILTEVMEAVCSEAVPASNVSAAVVYRLIEDNTPTLILDECDSFLKDNEEMRGILNSGHTRRQAFVLRCVGDEHEVRRYSTYMPTVLSGIGKKAATLEDRSIHVRLVKVNGADRPPRVPFRHYEEQEVLRQKLAKWAAGAKVKFIEIEATANPRTQDNWSVLYSIALVLGEEWPEACLTAYRKECQRETTEEVRGLLLLKDIHRLFSEDHDDIGEVKGRKRLKSSALTTLLNTQEESPWKEMGRDGLTANKLGAMLADFDVRPRTLAFGKDRKKGYCESFFREAFEAYIEPEPDEEPEIEPEIAEPVDLVI